MRIQHNIMAMSAYRNYTNNVSAMKKNLEKLSSGYKINRAGDDAAGLAISEKMRAQITGLETAQKNAKDGISLVQTAEGALTEVHDMLNRMVELATQSANGTYEDTTDRKQLQKEVDQLKAEINRISKASNFNGIQLLDGSLDGTSAAMDTVEVTFVTLGKQNGVSATAGVYTIDIKDLTAVNKNNAAATGTIKIGSTVIGTITGSATGTGKEVEFTASVSASAVKISGVTYNITKVSDTQLKLTAANPPTTSSEIPSGANLRATVEIKGAQGDGTGDQSTNHSYDLAFHVVTAPQLQDSNKVAQGKFTLSAIKDNTAIKIGDQLYTFKVGKNSKVADGTNVIDLSNYEEGDAKLQRAACDALSQQSNDRFDITTDGVDMYLTEKVKNLGLTGGKYESQVDYTKDWDLSKAEGWNTPVAGGNQTGSVVQFGPKSKGLTLQIGDTADSYNRLSVDIKACNTTSLGLDAMRIDRQEDAQKAVDIIKKAINTVSDVRGGLGATQNRLEHTINNLSVMTENIQDAESTIRDTDVAEEMMAYTKNNILIQSAQAMLAQANQVPQGVLQLLQ